MAVLGIVVFYNYPALAIFLLAVVGVVWWASRRSARYRTMEATELAGLLANVRSMSGAQFEAFVAEVFRAMGHRAQVMGGSGDQGVDVIVATPDGRKIAVQCKNYAKPVGNKPVQEVYAGAAHHGCSQGWVVAPAGFTRGAFELAASVGVSLFDEGGIRAWIGQVEEAARAREEAQGSPEGKDASERRPRGNWIPHPDDDATRPAQGEKVSTIGGRVVPDTEAYDALLDNYEEYLDLLEKLHETRREHEHSYRVDASVREQWEKTRGGIERSIGNTTAKLDVLEGRNPGLAAGERVSRRARLASRHEGIGSAVPADSGVDFADQIRRLAELRDEGLLTDEEFEAKKAEILRRMS